jgi:hypothetical protein
VFAPHQAQLFEPHELSLLMCTNKHERSVAALLRKLSNGTYLTVTLS